MQQPFFRNIDFRAAILQGGPENAVLPCATNRQQILEGWMIWIIWWDNTNRYKDRNDQRQRKQIRPTRSAGGSNCFLPSYFTPFGHPVRSETLVFYPAGSR